MLDILANVCLVGGLKVRVLVFQIQYEFLKEVSIGSSSSSRADSYVVEVLHINGNSPFSAGNISFEKWRWSPSTNTGMSPSWPCDSTINDFIFHAKPDMGGSDGSISVSENIGAISIASPAMWEGLSVLSAPDKSFDMDEINHGVALPHGDKRLMNICTFSS
jgi:hypothetical protein